MRRPCARGRTLPALPGVLGAPPYGYYGPCARSSLDDVTHEVRCGRKRGPGSAGGFRAAGENAAMERRKASAFRRTRLMPDGMDKKDAPSGAPSPRTRGEEG
jgi:hypothetical protein